MSSHARRRTSARSRGEVAAQPAAAPSAASTAASASSTLPSATVVSTRPVAGSSTSNRPPSEAGTALPPIHRSVSRSGLPRSSSDIRWSLAGSEGVGDYEVLRRVQGEDARAVGGDDDLLLDARGREAVVGRAVGL